MQYDKGLPNKILTANNRQTLLVGSLQKVTIPETKSGIILNNDNILWCAKFDGLEGLFRKDIENTFAYGRRVCDTVKDIFQNYGFFTSDELPRYGITRKNIRELFNQVDKEKQDGVLVAIFAYDQETSLHIRKFLVDHFRKELSFPIFEQSPIEGQIST